MADREGAGPRGLEDVETHDVACGVEQQQIQVIEFDNAVEAFGEVVKESAQVAMLSNRFRHLEKSL
jgi:hypothetical protein